MLDLRVGKQQQIWLDQAGSSIRKCPMKPVDPGFGTLGEDEATLAGDQGLG